MSERGMDLFPEIMMWALAAFSGLAIVAGDIGGVIGVVGCIWLALALRHDRRTP